MIKQIRSNFEPCRPGKTNKTVRNLMNDICFGQQTPVDRSEPLVEHLVEFIQMVPTQALQKLLQSNSRRFDQPGLPGFVPAISEF